MHTKTHIRNTALVVAALFPLLCGASPIVIDVLDGGDTPDSLGGFDLTPFDQPAIPSQGCGPYGDGVTSTASPLGGHVEFESRSGDPLCMSVQDPDWWQYDHGNVFTTDVPWVELVLPYNTRAIALWVGANLTGRGWIEGIDDSGNTSRTYFGGNTGVDFGPNDTPGFGVHTTGSCSMITRIIIEPFEWGTGNFAINQDPCTQVPEPGTLWLFGIGMLGLAFTHRLAMRRRLKPASN